MQGNVENRHPTGQCVRRLTLHNSETPSGRRANRRYKDHKLICSNNKIGVSQLQAASARIAAKNCEQPEV